MSSAASSPLAAEIEYVKKIPIVVMAGRLESSNTSLFESRIAPLLARPHPRILIDMQALDFVGSMGLRSLLKLIKHATASGSRAGAFSVPPVVLDVLEKTAFTRLFDIYPDREAALKASRA